MDSLGFTTNNVKGLATSRIKRIKVFLHLQSLIKNTGFIFMQETHSSDALAQEFKEDFGHFYVMTPQMCEALL